MIIRRSTNNVHKPYLDCKLVSLLLLATFLQLVSLTPCHAAKGQERGKFQELPADLPLPALPIHGVDWTANAIIIQPWGYTQRQMMGEELGSLPQELKQKYGFNVLCVMPPRALAAVGGGQQTEAAFTHALAAYRKAGYKIMLYSSQVNAGHDPLWYDALKQHPEWKQVNPKGKSANWLCPNSPAFDFNLDYTKQIVARYGCEAVLLDNNMFASPDDHVGVACYCSACETKFRSYVAARLGKQCQSIFGIASSEVKIPTAPGPFYNLWKHWRNRSYAETTERVRKSLPGVVVVANTQYWWWTMGKYGWALASDLQYPHEDMVLSESYGTEAYGMPNQTSSGISAKLIMGRAVAGERPLCDLIGTFEWNSPRFEPLKPPAIVQRRLGVALMYLAQPWLGYYGMEGGDSRSIPSREALSRLLLLRARHPELYTNLRSWSAIGSLLPNGSYNCFGPTNPVVPPHVLSLRKRGIASVGLYDLTLASSELTPLQLIITENATCLPPQTASLLVKWIRRGGTLLTTSDVATHDEIGRERSASKIAELLRTAELKTMCVGKGQLIVASPSELSEVAINRTDEVFGINGAEAGQLELQPYISSDRRRVVLHVINHGDKMTGNWRLSLPAALATSSRNALMLTPESDAPFALHVTGRSIELPPIDAYAVITMENGR